MVLAGMLSADEDALICDFAEYYHIYDWRALPVMTAATLACGLRPDSRIKMALAGLNVSADTVLLAGVLDRLTTLVWFQTKDGQKGRNRPESVVEKLTAKPIEETSFGYDSAADFEAARALILGGASGG